jgi:hypothetical protein
MFSPDLLKVLVSRSNPCIKIAHHQHHITYRRDQSTRTGITSKGSSQISHKKFSTTREINGKTTLTKKSWKTIEEKKEVKIKRCAESNPQRTRELDQTYTHRKNRYMIAIT